MRADRKAYLDLHIAVILFGFTAILGKLITLSAVMLIWWRVLFTAISLVFLLRLKDIRHQVGRKDLLIFVGIGIIISLHWLCFYGSIKYSNASIALICLATTSFLTAFVQPLILKVSFKWYEMALGLLVVPGIWLVVQGVDVAYTKGVWVGLMSAVFAAIFSVLNKKMVLRASTVQLTFIELSSAWLFLSLLLPFLYFGGQISSFWPRGIDWLYLLVLALACTTLAQILSVRALRHISAFASNLVISLEPVYGILMAIFLLHEDKELNWQFYLGMAIILISVFGYPYIRSRFEKSA